MLRRFIVVALAAALTAPIVVVPPASAVVLLTCTTLSASSSLTPGLSHTPTAQSDMHTAASISGCSSAGGGGPTGATLVAGAATFPGSTPTTTYGPRPLGCPVGDGGAGPDYPDQTPILISGDPGFRITWTDNTTSSGIVKFKSSGPPVGGLDWKIEFPITSGRYKAPAGKKTRLKGVLRLTATDTGSCSSDADPYSQLSISNVGNLFLNQK
jgi:hypothetical protein